MKIDNYEKGKRKMGRKNSKVCPECESKNVVPIIYGMPTCEVQKKEEEGKIQLGGCCIMPDSPRYACNDCHCIWGGEELLEKSYEDIKRIKASVGGYSGPNYEVEIDFVNGIATWKEGMYQELEHTKDLDAASSTKYIKELSNCRVLNWGQQYIEPCVLDGTQWSVEIDFDDACVCKYGSNAYPKEWKRFCRLIEKCVRKPFR